MLPATVQFLITMLACAINERMQWAREMTCSVAALACFGQEAGNGIGGDA